MLKYKSEKKSRMKRVFGKLSRGSVLAYTLILLGIVLTASMGMLMSSMRDLRSVGMQERSMQAFQIANSGSEMAISAIKNDPSDISGLATGIGDAACSAGEITKTALYLGGEVRLSFFDDSGTKIISCSEDVYKIASVKSVGTFKETARAIEVSIPYSAQLIGWWKFNGNADDETSNGNDGALSGVPLPTFASAPPNASNQALGINAGSGVMTIPDESDFDFRRTISISLWLKAGSLPAAAGTRVPLVSKMADDGSASSHAYSLWINDAGFLRLTSSDSAAGTPRGCDTASDAIATGNWYHYVGVIDRDSGAFIHYINGNLTALGASCSLPPGDAVANNNPVRIGGKFGAFEVFDGQIDDVRIYDGILTPTQINALYGASGNGRE